MSSSLSWSFMTPASPIIGSAVPSTTASIRSSTRRLSLSECNPHSHVLSYSIPMSIFTLVQSRRRLLTLISPSYTPSTIHCNTHAVSPPFIRHLRPPHLSTYRKSLPVMPKWELCPSPPRRQGLQV